MPTNPEQPEEQNVTIQSVVKLVSTARPNTIIGGSIGDGDRPIGDGRESGAPEAPRKSS